MAAALDIDGAPLSGVDMLGPPEGGRLQFGNVDEPAALLDYVFGYGGRQILLSCDGGSIEGWLETRWEGSHRTWWLELDDWGPAWREVTPRLLTATAPST